MLWEEQVPLMRQGFHRELVRKAYGPAANGRPVYPLRQHVFDALRITSLENLKVVIIGQDPYFNEHPGKGPEAHGLCFSVRKGIPQPPSLRNILQEINDSVYQGKTVSVDTDLTRLARQGVLLLNASLTVIARQPNSHADLGWHELTDDIIRTVSAVKEHVVFMLWGAYAQKNSAYRWQKTLDPDNEPPFAALGPSRIPGLRGVRPLQRLSHSARPAAHRMVNRRAGMSGTWRCHDRQGSSYKAFIRQWS